MFLNPDGCSERSTVPADQVGSKEKSFLLRYNLLWRAVLLLLSWGCSISPPTCSVSVSNEDFKWPEVTFL